MQCHTQMDSYVEDGEARKNTRKVLSQRHFFLRPFFFKSTNPLQSLTTKCTNDGSQLLNLSGKAVFVN